MTQESNIEDFCHKLAEAIRLTQEYCGDNILPPIPGWSWFDALQEYEQQFNKQKTDEGNYV